MNIRPVGAELFYADADGPGGGGGGTDMTTLFVTMRTQLISHHGACLSMQPRKMVHAKGRRIV